jgi:hypothetical protein
MNVTRASDYCRLSVTELVPLPAHLLSRKEATIERRPNYMIYIDSEVEGDTYLPSNTGLRPLQNGDRGDTDSGRKATNNINMFLVCAYGFQAFCGCCAIIRFSPHRKIIFTRRIVTVLAIQYKTKSLDTMLGI